MNLFCLKYFLRRENEILSDESQASEGQTSELTPADQPAQSTQSQQVIFFFHFTQTISLHVHFLTLNNLNLIVLDR